MTMAVETISPAQALRIINLQEGHFSEVKSIDILPGKLTRHIAALANAEGGELYVGIDEDLVTKNRSWRGFARPEDANSHIAVFESLFPLGQYFSYAFLTSQRLPGYVLQMIISKTPDVKAASDGLAYLRRNAQSLPVDTDEKRGRLRLDKGLTSFESET